MSRYGSVRAQFVFVLAAALIQPMAVRAQWVQSMRVGDVAYFLFASAPRLERYVLTNEHWLMPITLPTVHGPATAFTVEDTMAYVAYGRTAKRYPLTGSVEFHVGDAPDTIVSIFIDGDVVFLNHSVSSWGQVTSVNKTNGAVVAELVGASGTTLSGASAAPGINKLFGRTLTISPSDITYASYRDDGTFIVGNDGPYHGSYPGATRTWVFPGEDKVVDDSGTVYGTADLSYSNSLGGTITDLTFFETNRPLVLRGSQLVAYASSLLPTGSKTLSFSPRNIQIVGTNVLTFSSDIEQANGIRVDTVPLSDLKPAARGQPVDPVGLAYTPDASFVDRNGVLYLLSKGHQSLFRWSLATQSYLPTLPLVGSPRYVAYSATNHTAYLLYTNRAIWRLDLNSADPVETPLATLAGNPLGLSTAGAYVFAVDNSGSQQTHYTFDAEGVRVDMVDWAEYSTEYILERCPSEDVLLSRRHQPQQASLRGNQC